MSRRVTNYYYFFTKAGAMPPEAAVERDHPLVMFLQTVMTPEARQQYGRRGQESAFADNVALHAALDGLGQARGCKKHFTSYKLERNLLRSAYRRLRKGEEKVKAQEKVEFDRRIDPDDGFDREPWQFAVRDLIQLTCRFPTYIRLFFPRLHHLWKGSLAEVIWPARPQGPALSHQINSFVGMDVELTTALALLHEGDQQNDAVNAFLRRLDKAALSDPLTYESWERRPAWLQHVLDALPDPLPPTSCYPHVAEALGRLGMLRDRFVGSATLGGAWSDLGRELVAPRVLPADESPPESMVAVLDVFYHDEHHHAEELPPAAVLRAILGLSPEPAVQPVAPGAAPKGFDQTRQLLIDHLRHATREGSPEDDVLSAALTNTNMSFDVLRDTIHSHPPATLTGDLLVRMLSRLGAWLAEHKAQQMRSRAWNQKAAPPDSLELWDLDEAAWDEGVLSEAIQAVSAWIESPEVSRPSWAELPWRTARALRSAVASACLDYLCKAMDSFFRSLRTPDAEPER